MKKNLRKIILTLCVLCATCIVGGTIKNAVAENVRLSENSNKPIAYKPDIFVDWGEYTPQNVPNAALGKKYALFNATAEDVYGDNVAVNAKVYLHYKEENQADITVKNFAFTPKYCGVYTAVYTAKDVYGNIQSYEYEIVCEETETLEVALQDCVKQSFVGETVAIAEIETKNEMGVVHSSVIAKHEDGKNVYDLTGETTFTPMKSGVYTIAYTVSDYSITIEKSYTLKVEKHNRPIVLEEAAFPRYFIVGREYVLPTAKAYQFSLGEAVEICPEVLVSYGVKKPFVLEHNRKFTPTEEGEVTFVYNFAFGDNVETRTYTAQSVDVGYKNENKFDIAKYFYSKNSLIEATSNEVYSVTQTEGAEVMFINALSTRSIDFNFSIDQSKNNFSQMDFYLTDSINPTLQVKLSYVKISPTESIIRINDGKEFATDAKFNQTESVQFTYLEDSTATVGFFGKSYAVGTDISGEIFNGFPSGKAYVSYVVKGVTGATKINILNIGNQALYEMSGDGSEPIVTFKSYVGELKKIGDLISVDRIYVQDVLDVDFTVKYSIMSPNGDYVVDENGLLLSEDNTDYTKAYTFRARMQGNYLVNMVVMDSCGNSATYAYAIKVGDATPPTVSLAKELPTQIKLGETIEIATLKIIDDTSKECSVYVSVIAPYMSSYPINVGDHFKAVERGTYVLCYTVSDEVGNTTCFTYEFKVV